MLYVSVYVCVRDCERERETGFDRSCSVFTRIPGRLRKAVGSNGCGVTSKELFHTCWDEKELNKTQSRKGRGGLGQERAASRKGSCNNHGCNI